MNEINLEYDVDYEKISLTHLERKWKRKTS